MKLLWKVPKLSQPFFIASLADAIGIGILAGAVEPFAGVIARRLGASAELLTIFTMAPFLGFMFAAPASRLMYAYRWGSLLRTMRMLIRLPFLFFMWIVNPYAFVGLLVWSSTVDGASKPLYDSLVRAHVRISVRPALYKWIRIVSIVLSLPAAWITAKLLDASPEAYKYIFSAAGVLAVLTVLPLSQLPSRFFEHHVRKTEVRILDEFRLLASDKRFLAFMVVFFVGTFGEKLLMPVTPIYFTDILNLRYQDVGLATGLIGPICGIAGYLFWGWRLTKTSPLIVLILCMFLKAAKPLIWALAFYHPSPVLCVVIGEATFRFFIAGMEMSSALMVLQLASSGQLPLYMGIHYLFMGVRGLAGPVGGLWLYRMGMGIQNIYWITAAVVILGGVALMWFRRWPGSGEFYAGIPQTEMDEK